MKQDAADTLDYTDGLVSVVMPAYNCEKYVGESIESVLAQDYQNWELIVVNDGSSDKTASIIESYALRDRRIILLHTIGREGASKARNIGLDVAKGKYIAFLDSDDIWLPGKLNKQIQFMRMKSASFTCTAYEQMSENGTRTGCVRTPPEKVDYTRLLYLGDTIGNLTAMYDRGKLGIVRVPDIAKRNDYALWLKILRTKCEYAYGLDEPLACYRVRKGSLSEKNLDLVRHQWYLYRTIEGLSLLKASFALVFWGCSKRALFAKRN